MSVDELLGAVFMASHEPGKPSIIYKLNATTLETYGVIRMQSRGPYQEMVQGIAQVSHCSPLPLEPLALLRQPK